MVGLDLSQMDDALIKYVTFLCSVFQEVEQVLFFHNIKHRFPETVVQELAVLEKPLAEYIKEDIEEKVADYFSERQIGLPVEVMVTNQVSTTKAIVETAKTIGVDLLLLGNKVSYTGSGIVPAKLMRAFECNVLYLPETAYHRISNILVPIDFSKYATKALSGAFYMHDQIKAEVSGIHVYNLPQRYFPYIPVDDVRSSLRNHAQQAYQKFLKSNPILAGRNFECHFTSNKGKSIAAVVAAEAVQQNVDFIIVGSRGKNAFTSLMVGSVTTGLMNMPLHVPLLILK